MKKLFIMVLALVSVMSCATAQDLVILHTNDTHSQIEPIRVGYNKGLGGVERRLQYVNSVRQQYGNENVLFLDGGDYNQGTPYFTLGRGYLEVELCNALGIDVATLGNHEFDNGMEELSDRLKKARHKTVTCNYDFSNTPLRGIVKPYAIVRRGGLKIGIIGVTSYLEGVVMKSHTEGLVRLDSVAEVNRWADFLKNRKHCDLVILLSHFGYQGGDYDRPSDIFMVEHSRNLDMVVGGHSHTFLAKAKEVRDMDGRIVPITQCGGQGTVVGTWKITLSRP
ncbi:MAG: metallophosphatase [Bacteroidales bacterium]|nr:metallophosphatase [Candidatus Cacconaster merdequi]